MPYFAFADAGQLIVCDRRSKHRSANRYDECGQHREEIIVPPKEIDDERNLRESHDPRRPRDRRVPLKTGQTPNVFARQRPALAAIVPTAMHAEHSL